MLYYAIADIHGCSAALDALLDQVAAHAQSVHGGRDFKIVLLGDYVDRGPDSAGVLDRAIALEAAGHVVLPGNHEQMMWAALTGQDAGYDAWARWRRNGAETALRSYGLDDEDGVDASRISPLHVAFLNRLFDGRPVHYLDRTDALLFVHAGVTAEAPLADQRTEILLWQRLAPDDDRKWVEGLHVVHGHTPRPRPIRNTHRTGLDTGAVYGGVLSAGVFVDGALSEILSAPGLTAGSIAPPWG